VCVCVGVCCVFGLIYFVYQTFNVVYNLLKSSSNALKSMLQILLAQQLQCVWVCVGVDGCVYVYFVVLCAKAPRNTQLNYIFICSII